MTDPRRRFPALPPEKFLTPKIVELHAEADDLAAQLKQADLRLAELSSETAAQAASDVDRSGQAAAVRAGQSAASVGTPAQDGLRADTEATRAQIDALLLAVRNVEDELESALQELHTDDKLSCRAALNTTRIGYSKALDALAKARDEYMTVKAVHDWLAAIAGAPNYGGGPWRGTDKPVQIDQLSRAGERDYHIKPVPLAYFIDRTLRPELEN